MLKQDKDRIIKIIRYSREIVEYSEVLKGLNINTDPVAVNKVIKFINMYHKLLKDIK